MPQVTFTDLIAAARRGDRLVSFPTDTVAALAVRPDRAALIFAAKRRSQTKPLILMGAEIADLWQFVQGSDAEMAVWQKIAAQYLPGALTMILPASDRLPPAVNPTNPTTIGIRVPNHPIARQILAQTAPLATTSVNRSGEPPLQSIAVINTQFPNVLTLSPTELEKLQETLTPPKNQPQPGTPSTVAKWTGSGWEILRQGSVQLEA